MLLFAVIVAVELGRALVSVGIWAGAITAVLAAIAAISRTPVGRAVRWVLRKLVHEPVSEMFTNQVTEAMTAVITPQLMEIREDARRLEAKNDAQHADNRQGIVEMREQVDGLRVMLQAAMSSQTQERDRFARHLREAERLARRLNHLEDVLKIKLDVIDMKVENVERTKITTGEPNV